MRHARRSALVTAALAVLVVAYALACAGLWRARGEWILREDCEIDFAHDYAFDALRIGEGVPPGDEYRGPLYPALLAFLHSRGAGLVRAGAWITVGSSLLALVLTFLICRRATGSGIFALAAASALALFPPFLKCSLLLGTDMLFAALLLSSVCLILPPGGTARAGAAGFCMGIALAVRWNALGVAPVTALLVLLPLSGDPPRARLGRCLAFLAGFALGSAPACLVNVGRGRGLVENSNFRNIGWTFYGAELGLDYHAYFDALPFKMMGDLLRFRGVPFFLGRWAVFFARYIARYLAELMPPLGILAACSVAGAFIRRFPGRFLPPFIVCCLFIQSLGMYGERYILALFALGLCAAAATAAALVAHARGARARATVSVATASAFAVACLLYAAADAPMLRGLCADRHRLGAYSPPSVRASRGASPAELGGFETLASFAPADIARDWRPNRMARILYAAPGAVRIRCAPRDPMLTGPEIRLAGGEIWFMARMRAIGNEPRTVRERVRDAVGFGDWVKMKVFWATEREPQFDEARSSVFFILPSEEEQVHVVRILGDGSFPGGLVRVRLDPGEERRQYEIAEIARLRRRSGGQALLRERFGG